MICEICKLPINKGDKIAVFSVPLTALDKNGTYDIFGGFFSNEHKVHAKCFKVEKVKNLPPQFSNKNISDNTTKDLYEALREVGEDVEEDEISNFIADNLEITELSELVGEWFKNRNGVV